MDDQPEVTRADLDETRASLSEKLETLEQQVVHSVHGASNAVNETVESVKDAVHDMVATVKETFDLPLQVKRHPWGMMGGSIALGYFGGYLLRRRASDRLSTKRWSEPVFPDGPRITQHGNGVINGYRSTEVAPTKKPIQEVSQKPSEPSFLSDVHHQFEAEISKLKGLAIGAVLGVVRDLITHSGPEQIKTELADVMDSITVKLGGEPIQLACPARESPNFSNSDFERKSSAAEMVNAFYGMVRLLQAARNAFTLVSLQWVPVSANLAKAAGREGCGWVASTQMPPTSPESRFFSTNTLRKRFWYQAPLRSLIQWRDMPFAQREGSTCRSLGGQRPAKHQPARCFANSERLPASPSPSTAFPWTFARPASRPIERARNDLWKIELYRKS